MSKFFYNSYNAAQEQSQIENSKAKEFLERISKFKQAKTLQEAKELAEKILPTKSEITKFSVGNIKCTIINRTTMFRLSVDTPKEFICYDFE